MKKLVFILAMAFTAVSCDSNELVKTNEVPDLMEMSSREAFDYVTQNYPAYNNSKSNIQAKEISTMCGNDWPDGGGYRVEESGGIYTLRIWFGDGGSRTVLLDGNIEANDFCN